MTIEQRKMSQFRIIRNIAVAILLLECVSRTSCKHRPSSSRNEAVITNVRCRDRNFERTLTWSPQNVSDDLSLMHFTVTYCVAEECNVKNFTVHCYDKERKNRVKVVNTTYCKTSLRHMTRFDNYIFFVRGIYRNFSSNATIRTAHGVKSCDSIEKKTSLGPPSVSTSPEKETVNVRLVLPEDLQRTFDDLKTVTTTIDLPITYFFCIAEYETDCGDKNRRRKSINPVMRYPIPLTPSTDYVVLGWYTIQSESYLLPSEKAKGHVRTLADPFPQWLQILVICSIASVVVLSILSTVAGRYINSKSKGAKEAIRKPIGKFLVETINESRSPGQSGYLLVDFGTNWTVFLADERSIFPPIKRLSESEKRRMEESSRPVAATATNTDLDSTADAADKKDLQTMGDPCNSLGSNCNSRDLPCLQPNVKTPVEYFENDDVHIAVRSSATFQMGRYASHSMEPIVSSYSTALPEDYVRHKSGGACNPGYCEK